MGSPVFSPPPPRPTLAYDPSKTAKAALKVAVYAGLGVILADATGLTSWLVTQVPAQYAQIGALVITAAIAALKNWYQNQGRG